MELASLIDQLAELDRNPTGDYIAIREQTVAQIAIACKQVDACSPSDLPALEQALARTAQLREIALQERIEIQNALQSLETHHKQLKSFYSSNEPDNGLLDRLA